MINLEWYRALNMKNEAETERQIPDPIRPDLKPLELQEWENEGGANPAVVSAQEIAQRQQIRKKKRKKAKEDRM